MPTPEYFNAQSDNGFEINKLHYPDINLNRLILSKINSLFRRKSTDTFIGIIDEDGVYKSSINNEHVLTFSFFTYQKNNSSIQEKEAVVHKIIPNTNFNTQGLEPLSIVKISGEQIDYHGQNRIVLSSVLKTSFDHQELQKVKVKRQQSIRFESKTFGIFELNRNIGWFETKAKWSNQEIEIFLSGELTDLPAIESHAIKLFEVQGEWEKQFKHKISTDLLALKNENWREECEVRLTHLEFQERINLESLQFHENGDFEAWYADGDLFWGHAISLSGNINGYLENANLSG